MSRIVYLMMAFVVSSIVAASAQDRPVPTEEELEAYGDAVASVYQWEQQYEPTVDGLIEASRQMRGVWSGSSNADTEDERVALVRQMLLDRRDEVLFGARARLVDAADPYDVMDHLERVTAGEILPEDTEMRDVIQRVYRDAIFDGMIALSVKAQEQVDNKP